MKAKILRDGGYGTCFGMVDFPTQPVEVRFDRDGFFVTGAELIRIGARGDGGDSGFDALDEYYFFDDEVEVDESVILLTPKQFLGLQKGLGPFEYYNATKSQAPRSIKLGTLIFEEIVDA